MTTEEYLAKYQPNAYQLFKNVLSKNIFFHAYLLSGPKGSSLNKIALFLAKSLLCENSIFACDNCSICKRVDALTYGDLLFFDAKNDPIKVDIIRDKIEGLFSQSASEKRGIKVYVINNIEYLSTQGLNVLLKFLEEPPNNTYAIFTSENEGGVLPTILSRCEIVRFKNIDKHNFLEMAKKEGFESQYFEYAALISNDYEEIKELCNDKNFNLVVDNLKELINRLIDKYSARFYLESTFLKIINSKEMAYYFYDLLIALLNETLNKTYVDQIVFSLIEPLVNILKSRIKDLNKVIISTLEDEYQIKNNINLNLLILHTFKAIVL